MLGRVKKVKPFLTGEYGCIAPTPNYDCHVAEDDLDLTSMDLTDAIAYNFVSKCQSEMRFYSKFS